jgi:hypothetical protein
MISDHPYLMDPKADPHIQSIYNTALDIHNGKVPFNEDQLNTMSGMFEMNSAFPNLTGTTPWTPKAQAFIDKEAKDELLKNYHLHDMTDVSQYSHPNSKLPMLHDLDKIGPNIGVPKHLGAFFEKYGDDPQATPYVKKLLDLNQQPSPPKITLPKGPPAKDIHFVPDEEPSDYEPPKIRNEFAGPTLPHNPSGLDLSTEARMQRAVDMGANLDLPLYRGMNRHFEDHYGTFPRDIAFLDPSTKKNEPGIFSATDPRVANAYATGNKGAQVIPLYSLAKNVKVVDWPTETGTSEYNGAGMQKVLKQALSEGHDAVHIKNIRDIGPSGPQEQYVNFHPNQLRSVNAVFNPKYKDSPNLLASRGIPLTTVLTPVDHDPFDQNQK